MLQVPISSETFNPVVVDRFLAICSTLPADQLARMVEKIRNESWILLMSAFRLLGFEYKKMFKTLADAKNYQSLLVLAEAVLAVRTQEEIEKASSPSSQYSLSTLTIYHLQKFLSIYPTWMLNTGNRAFGLTTNVMAEVIASLNGEKLVLSDLGQLRQLAEQEIGHAEEENEKVFKVDDSLYTTHDVDFFDLDSGREDRWSPKDDVCELAVVIKVVC